MHTFDEKLEDELLDIVGNISEASIRDLLREGSRGCTEQLESVIDVELENVLDEVRVDSENDFADEYVLDCGDV